MQYQDIQSEQDLQKFITQQAEKQHWYTTKEAKPDQTKHWNKSWRADIIIEKPPYGRIGIELKYTDKEIKGKTLTKAINQVNKYQNCTYNNKIVPFWAILPYQKEKPTKNATFTQSILTSLGIGTVEIRKWSGIGGIIIDFCKPDPTKKVPVGLFEREDLNPRYEQQIRQRRNDIFDDYHNDFDRKELRKWINKKHDERNYIVNNEAK